MFGILETKPPQSVWIRNDKTNMQKFVQNKKAIMKTQSQNFIDICFILAIVSQKILLTNVSLF